MTISMRCACPAAQRKPFSAGQAGASRAALAQAVLHMCPGRPEYFIHAGHGYRAEKTMNNNGNRGGLSRRPRCPAPRT